MSNDEYSKVWASLERIERALVGDEELGQTGIVASVKDHEKRLKSIEHWLIRVGGICLGVGALYKVFEKWL